MQSLFGLRHFESYLLSPFPLDLLILSEEEEEDDDGDEVRYFLSQLDFRCS
jgi:hypothetical protein